jgi:cytidylate kinase
LSVITISRGSFSGGKLLAECLARRLGFRCIDRDVIVERAAASGISQEALRDALEKPPGFLDRFSHKKYVYLALIQAALAEEVRTGRAIYHGLAGHLLLKSGPHILRARIIAPLEFRISMAQARLKLDRDQAIAYINRMDQQRRKWTQFLYGVDWGDPSLYDVVLNLETIDIEDACRVIGGLAEQRCFAFTPEYQTAMDDLALSSRVRANIALNGATSNLEVEVAAHGGVVAVKGRLVSVDQLEEVERIARAVPGVTEVNLNELAPNVQV